MSLHILFQTDEERCNAVRVLNLLKERNKIGTFNDQKAAQAAHTAIQVLSFLLDTAEENPIPPARVLQITIPQEETT